MIAELLAAVRLIWDAVRSRGTRDAKRPTVAKEVLTFHRHVEDVVRRGHRILDIYENGGDRQMALVLFQEQVQTIDQLQTTFSTEALKSIIDVHVPELSGSFREMVFVKRRRIILRWTYLQWLDPGNEHMERLLSHMGKRHAIPALNTHAHLRNHESLSYYRHGFTPTS